MSKLLLYSSINIRRKGVKRLIVFNIDLSVMLKIDGAKERDLSHIGMKDNKAYHQCRICFHVLFIFRISMCWRNNYILPSIDAALLLAWVALQKANNYELVQFRKTA